MKNEFVPYDIALAVWELSFNEPCLAFYTEDKDLFINKNLEVFPNLLNKSRINAPLYQQLFRWFREEHKLSGDVFPVSDDPFKQGGSYHACLTDLSGEEWLGDEELGLHRNYEEAQEACLRKLIEITKQ